MPQVLILGAGLVAGPLVDYLHKKGISITLASQFLEEAQNLAKNRDHIRTISFDVSCEKSLGDEVKKHQVVVSFIPFQLHLRVAQQCLKYNKHLVTASYRSEEMAALDEVAKEKNITILNEIGFDPGVDHLSAMSIIDQVHDKGGQVETFVSWGAGLPSPEDCDNPFGYKFAWAPKGVLLAMVNEACYLKNGKVIRLPADNLLDERLDAWTGENMEFAGYPNRDSVPYKEAYGLNEVKTLLRGTLRYRGNLRIMQYAKILGLLDATEREPFKGNWRMLMCELSDLSSERVELDLPCDDDIKEAFNWLGLFDENKPVPPSPSRMDAFCEALQEKLVFQPGERDMALLIHKFGVLYPDGKKVNLMSKLKIFGEGDDYTAMAKAVGTPAAIATELLLNGQLKERGSILPVSREYYSNMLPILEAEGIRCEESEVFIDEKEFLKEVI